MNELAKKLQDERKVGESTANGYIRSLYSLNGKAPFKNLAWAKKTEEVLSRVAEYAESTQRTLLATLVSVLSIAGPSYKKALKTYTSKMNAEVEKDKAAPKGRTEKQSENWMTVEEINSKKSDLEKDIAPLIKKKTLTAPEWNKLLDLMVLSLYTDQPPRRNLDYLVMNVAKKAGESTECNWLDLTTKKFVFNKYKTMKKYGQQVQEIPAPLMATIALYMKHHPLWNAEAKKSKEGVPFLVTADGAPLKAGNCITRILNRVLGKKVGASLLRHIFITDKFGAVKEEMEETAKLMGHSVGEQQGTYNLPGAKEEE
jgi:integrase